QSPWPRPPADQCRSTKAVGQNRAFLRAWFRQRTGLAAGEPPRERGGPRQTRACQSVFFGRRVHSDGGGFEARLCPCATHRPGEKAAVPFAARRLSRR